MRTLAGDDNDRSGSRLTPSCKALSRARRAFEAYAPNTSLENLTPRGKLALRMSVAEARTFEAVMRPWPTRLLRCGLRNQRLQISW